MTQAIGMISGSQSSFKHFTNSEIPSTNTNIKTSFRLNFNTHLSNRTGSSRFSTKAAVKDMYVTAEPKQSFYELLGVQETGTLSEIKQAYKQMARKYHPDVSPPERTEENTKMFIQVQEAYETLSDPKSRALYDSDLARGLHLAFSFKRWKPNNQEMEKNEEWRSSWEAQLAELIRRNNSKESRESNMSWGARMRKKRAESAKKQTVYC